MKTEKADPDKMRELIEDLGCCAKGHYCTLKEIVNRRPHDARTLVLIKCLEKFKYERSEREGRALDWNTAADMWVSEGRAETFARLFREGVPVDALYRAVMKESEQDGRSAP